MSDYKIDFFIMVASMITAVFYFEKAKKNNIPKARTFGYFICWILFVSIANHERGHAFMMILALYTAAVAFSSGIRPKREED